MKDKTIAHYKIRRELGRGGMGIVYEAEDTRLHRTVALKVLSPHLLSSEDDRARFYREARSAAQLNHPNIATVHAVEEAEDESGHPSPFIAMEYIEGKTLRAMIDEGPLKLDDAIRMTKDTAAALHAAHEKNIVHRDIKSANIMITDSGLVKVLDFGLAKTAQSTMLTKTGSTLGTAAYMSPEQATSADVDRRSDIWSLGVVLYEMVSGKLPFGAAYEQAVVYSILNEDPEPLTAIRTGVPLEVDRIVTKCLMKDPKLRYQHADDLAADLAAVQLGHTGMRTTTMRTAAPPVQTAGSAKSRPILPLLAGLGGLAIGVIAAWLLLAGRSEDSAQSAPEMPVHHLTLRLPDDAPFEPVGEAFLGVGQPALDISRDGKRIVYLGARDGSTKLFVRELDRDDVTELQGTEGATGPIFSPDGQWVAFQQNGATRKVSVAGGRPVDVAQVSEVLGGYWADDGEIVVSYSQGSGVARVPSGGGEVDYTPMENAGGSRVVGELPSPLPGGDWVLLSRTSGIIAVDFQGGRVTDVHPEGSAPRYSPSGHLIFALPGRLMAAPFDPVKLQLTGSPVPVIEDLRTEVVRRAGQYAFSETGTLIYAPGGAADMARLVSVGRDGAVEPLPFDPDLFGRFTLSPDGTKLAIVTQGSTPTLWIYDLERMRRIRVADDSDCGPAWMPEGDELLFCDSNPSGQGEDISAFSIDGGSTRTISEIEPATRFYSVSPDGRFLTVEKKRTARFTTLLRSLDGSAEDVALIDGSSLVWGAIFSPDGRFVSYTTDRSGRSQVEVVPIDGSGRRWQVSVDGGEEALWSQDGTELFFSNGTSWYHVAVTTKPDFSFGEPDKMFEGPYLNVPGYGYAVYPDAKHFILVESVTDGSPVHELKVVENWFAELERLAPTR